jgi:hypothetical protein
VIHERSGFNAVELQLNRAQYFFNHRSGPYLDIPFLQQVAGDISLPAVTRTEAATFQKYINKDGDTSIVHLCLVAMARHAFIRSGITRVDQVKDWLNEPNETRVRVNLGGQEFELHAKTRVALFNEAVAKAQAQE